MVWDHFGQRVDSEGSYRQQYIDVIAMYGLVVEIFPIYTYICVFITCTVDTGAPGSKGESKGR